MIDSGRIKLDGDFIRYRSKRYGEWDLALADVRVIGEATDDSGPFEDDYFLCFATGPGTWRDASFYAHGRDEFLSRLGERLGRPLLPELSGSTDFDSRVLWPPELAGEPMFRYTDLPARNWLARILRLKRNWQTYTDRVAAALMAAARDASTRGKR